MTKQAAFKRRVRTRMAKTGEKYNAARRALMESSNGNGSKGQGRKRKRAWVSEPTMGDEATREATGKGWDEWCDLLDAWPGHTEGHSAIAAYLMNEQDVPGWWAQTVAVGYERITGLRLVHQRPDGSFTANKSRTVTVDKDVLRAMLLDDSARDDLFPGFETELRSKPTTKVLRIGIGPGVALIAIDPKPKGRATVSVAHEKLPSADEVDEWKQYWGEWLAAIDLS